MFQGHSEFISESHLMLTVKDEIPDQSRKLSGRDDDKISSIKKATLSDGLENIFYSGFTLVLPVLYRLLPGILRQSEFSIRCCLLVLLRYRHWFLADVR